MLHDLPLQFSLSCTVPNLLLFDILLEASIKIKSFEELKFGHDVGHQGASGTGA